MVRIPQIGALMVIDLYFDIPVLNIWRIGIELSHRTLYSTLAYSFLQPIAVNGKTDIYGLIP